MIRVFLRISLGIGCKKDTLQLKSFNVYLIFFVEQGTISSRTTFPQRCRGTANPGAGHQVALFCVQKCLPRDQAVCMGLILRTITAQHGKGDCLRNVCAKVVLK